LGLWPFVPLASRAPTYGRLLVELLRDPRVPLGSKAVIAAAAAYIASPIDLVPDFVPIIGRIDDAAVLVLAFDFFLDSVPRQLVIEKMTLLGIDGRELERDLESARRAIPRPIRNAIRRLPTLANQAVFVGRREIRRRNLRRIAATSRTSTNQHQEEAPA
jgi:uncharacterized membrane protein YkvA (DUF1232 family)